MAIYHNQPHEGLGWDTPIVAWNKAMEEYGVRAAPGPEKQAQIFARPLTRKLEGDGITVLGVRYHSEALAKFGLHSHALNRKTSDRKVEIRCHPGITASYSARRAKLFLKPPFRAAFLLPTAGRAGNLPKEKFSLQKGQIVGQGWVRIDIFQ